MESHKPPIIAAHDADSPESPVEADRAGHPHCLLLLVQKILEEKQLLCLFLTNSSIRIFFWGPDILSATVQSPYWATTSKEVRSKHSRLHIHIPILQVQISQTTLRRLDLKQLSWLHSPQTAQILKDMKQSGIQWKCHLLVWYRIKELEFSYSTSKLREGIQNLVNFQLLLLCESRTLHPVRSCTALPFRHRS